MWVNELVDSMTERVPRLVSSCLVSTSEANGSSKLPLPLGDQHMRSKCSSPFPSPKTPKPKAYYNPAQSAQADSQAQQPQNRAMSSLPSYSSLGTPAPVVADTSERQDHSVARGRYYSTSVITGTSIGTRTAAKRACLKRETRFSFTVQSSK